MTTHRLISSRFPYVSLRITIQGQRVDLDAFLDTGFDGALAVPTGLFTGLGPPDTHFDWMLADGSGIRAPAYVGTIEMQSLGIYGVLITILGSEALLGRAVTDRSTVVLDHGRRLIVEP